MQSLDFEPIKTKGQFLANYEKHDAALRVFETWLAQKIPSYQLEQFGRDERNKNTWEAGNDKPDKKLITPDGCLIALIDVKGHDKPAFMINERAYKSYLQWANRYNVPCYIIWVIFSDCCIFWAKLPFGLLRLEKMPHDANWVIRLPQDKVNSINNFAPVLPMF